MNPLPTTGPVARLLSLLDGVRPNGGGFMARCPSHEDREASLHIMTGNDGRALLKCFAGCEAETIVDVIGLTMTDLFPPREDSARKAAHLKAAAAVAPITAATLAQDKTLPAGFLRDLGVEDRPDLGGLLIPYRNMDGSLAARQRLRTALAAKKGSRWLPGKGSPVPYGLERLECAQERGYLILVEGESDAWTLWFHGYPALGIPGADMAGKLTAEHVAGLDRVFYWREPDRGGDTFAAKIPARLREIGFAGKIYELTIDGLKDANELHKRNPAGFDADFSKAINEAAQVEPVEAAAVAEVAELETATTGVSAKTAAADLAEVYLKIRGLSLVYWRDALYRYTGSYYAEDPKTDRAADIIRFLQVGETRRRAGTRMASEIIANIEALCLVPADIEPPARLGPGSPVRMAGNFIPLLDGILDVDAYLRGDQNPIIAHSREWFFLHSLPFGFDPAATCELWLRTLRDNLPDDKYQQLLQEWFGLNLVLDTTFERFLLMYGEAGTGKTVACTGLRALLGEASISSVPLEAFSPSRTFPLAVTQGKLANVAEEIGDLDKAAEGILKQFVSGSPIQVERKHREPFPLTPTARLTFASNVLPRFVDRSNGIWRRMLILPFNNVVPPSKCDRRLLDVRFWQGSGEMRGVLLWALEGLGRLREQGGFTDPPDCRALRDQYKRDSNPAAVFLEEHCEYSLVATTPAPTLYKAYATSIKDMGHYPLSEPLFAREVRRKFPLVEKQENPTWQPDGSKVRLWLRLRFDGGAV